MVDVKKVICKKVVSGSLAALMVFGGLNLSPLSVNAAEKDLTTSYTINNWGSGYQVLIKVKNKFIEFALNHGE